jgi:hypothetical protein
MINRLPPHTPLKTSQLAIWAREFEKKPKAVLISIALSPTWQVTNLNERTVALETLVHRKLIERRDICSLFDFLVDDENFPIVISKDQISESDIPEGISRQRFEDPLEFTRCEFQRTNARLRTRAAELIAEHILKTDDLELLSDFNRETLAIIDNMVGEPYFLPENDPERPNEHLIDFIKVLYLTDTESATRLMNAIGIDENDLSLSLNQKELLRTYLIRAKDCSI